MSTLLIDRATCIATFDHADPAQGRDIKNVSLFVRDNLIEWIGPASELPPALREAADEMIDARGHLVVPGLVNTHHHMCQSLTRAIPAVQNVELFGWLRGLYPIWTGLTPEMVRVFTQVAMAELLMSGCTPAATTSTFTPTAFDWKTASKARRPHPLRQARRQRHLAVRRMLDAGVPMGLGVDGSASNDGAHMVAEARQALLRARVGRAMQPPELRSGKTFFGCDLGPAEMTARDALHLATRGGAQVLGRSDIGHLATGLCADLALFDLRTLGFAGGAVHDPVASLLLCASAQAVV